MELESRVDSLAGRLTFHGGAKPLAGLELLLATLAVQCLLVVRKA